MNDSKNKPGKIILIGAGPGDVSLLTLQGKSWLQKAEVILYDHLVNEDLLSFAQKETEIFYVGKKEGIASLEQEKINSLLIKKAKEGKVITRPFIFEGDDLELNVNALNGFIKVEILDDKGNDIPQFSGKSVKTYRGHNSLRLKPKWNGQANLSSLKGQTIRIRFTLQNTNLYSFKVL